MIKTIAQSVKELMLDRPFFSLTMTAMTLMVIYAIYTALQIEQMDIQVVTRYSALGEAHFYKAPWWYLYGFVAFGFIAAVAHGAIMTKLRAYGKRDLGMTFGWLSLIVVFIAFAYSYEVFRIAYL